MDPAYLFSLQCLHPSIMKDIEKHGYTAPTSIQAQSMPVALSGRDLLGCVETGNGKTAAFNIPMIQVVYFISMSYSESVSVVLDLAYMRCFNCCDV